MSLNLRTTPYHVADDCIPDLALRLKERDLRPLPLIAHRRPFWHAMRRPSTWPKDLLVHPLRLRLRARRMHGTSEVEEGSRRCKISRLLTAMRVSA